MSLKRRTADPVMMAQHNTLPTAEPQEGRKQKSPRKRGRPKGSNNQNRPEGRVSPYLGFVQETLPRFLQVMGDALKVLSVVLDGAFGPNEALPRVRQRG